MLIKIGVPLNYNTNKVLKPKTFNIVVCLTPEIKIKISLPDIKKQLDLFWHTSWLKKKDFEI